MTFRLLSSCNIRAHKYTCFFFLEWFYSSKNYSCSLIGKRVLSQYFAVRHALHQRIFKLSAGSICETNSNVMVAIYSTNWSLKMPWNKFKQGLAKKLYCDHSLGISYIIENKCNVKFSIIIFSCCCIRS